MPKFLCRSSVTRFLTHFVKFFSENYSCLIKAEKMGAYMPFLIFSVIAFMGVLGTIFLPGMHQQTISVSILYGLYNMCHILWRIMWYGPYHMALVMGKYHWDTYKETSKLTVLDTMEDGRKFHYHQFQKLKKFITCRKNSF